MSENSKIEWCDHTFNPWWGCEKVSPGCAHCYAESWSKRTGNSVWGRNAPRRFFGNTHWNEPLKWNRAARDTEDRIKGDLGNWSEYNDIDYERPRVFCGSMCDVFEDREDLVIHRQALFNLIVATPHLDWLLLTKRPENVLRMYPNTWMGTPPQNVWLGTSVEDQDRADERIPLLDAIPAAVKFLSCEPLLGPLDLSAYMGNCVTLADTVASYSCIDWIIVGGESGPKARPMEPEWARQIQAACQDAGVPFFFKQWGGRDKKAAGRELDGRTWDEFPYPATI